MHDDDNDNDDDDDADDFSSSRTSETQQAEFDPEQAMSSGFLEWSCVVVIMTRPRRPNRWHIWLMLFLIIDCKKRYLCAESFVLV